MLDVAPLVDQDGQIAPGLNPFAVHVSDDRLGGRAHGEGFLQLLPPRMGDHGALGREALDMLRLPLQKGVRDEEREIGIDVSGPLERVIEMPLHGLPDRVARPPLP